MDSQITMELWSVIAGVIAIVLATGSLTIGGVLAVVRQIRSDAALLKAIEGLTDSLPAKYVKTANIAGGFIGEISDFVSEITDGVPADEKVKPFGKAT